MTISKAPTATKEKQDISISWHSLDTNEVLEKLVTAHHTHAEDLGTLLRPKISKFPGSGYNNTIANVFLN